MADNGEKSLFIGRNDKQSLDTPPSGGNDKGIKNKLKNGFNDLVTDVKDSSVDFFNEVKSSIKDRLTLSSKRNTIVEGIEYGTEEVSIANRHRNTISGILDNTFSGNLFDAGVDTLNLLNFGTKWKIAYKQEIDRNIYPFKYLYYYNPLYKTKSSDKAPTEDSVTPASLTFLDDIEDPTILGFTLKIDYENSPLFKNVIMSIDKPTKSKSDKAPSEADAKNNNSNNNSITDKEMKNTALGFITDYKDFHPELNYASLYLQDFTNVCNKIFISPENQKDYNSIKYKNSYIYEIKGLNKLDNPFVDYKPDKEHESLELTLGEDIRMYVNRLAFLYRNLTWSYNMGKKLIPENMLRFNMYIKISEIRNYTSGVKDSNGDNEDNDDLSSAIRNGYSRVIYELKDCEFSFNESILPETLQMGGNEVNEKYAELKLKIKYRKVNRIFYSKLFSPTFAQNIIGDKFYTPNTEKYLNDLQNMKYLPENIIKNKSYTNNIPVEQSLKTKLNNLKNKGLLNQDNNDTAVTRFAKSVGNKAIKAGATILDDKIQKSKAGINDLGKNMFNNNLSSTVRDLLKEKVQTKSKMLGKSLHLNTGKQFTDSNEVISYSSSHLSNINNPKEDLHPNTGIKIKSPKEDLHPVTGIKTHAPSEDLHPFTGFKVKNPKEDLHPDTGFLTTSPKEDLHPDTGFLTTSPKEDLHPDTGFQTTSPSEDLHPVTGINISSPNEDLHPNSDFDMKNPNEDLHVSKKSIITNPDANVNPESNSVVKSPSEDLHSKTENNITSPKENLHNTNSSVINAPKEDLHPNTNKDIQAPKENVNDSFTKFIKKNSTPPNSSPLDSFE